MSKKRFIRRMALVLVFGLMMSSVAFAGVTIGTPISNELSANYTVTANTSANVDTIDELNAALGNAAINTIIFTGNIDATAPVIVNRALTINGGNHTLSFVGLESIATTVDDGLIIQAPAVVNNLIVDAGLAAPETWAGTYAIHLYKTTATLNNVTATKGNGGILVNGSDVTLTGAINVTGNGFGGIESSQGVGTGLPSLSVTGATFTNGSEAYGLPTIWEDKVTGTVTGANQFTVNANVKPVQVHYYLVAANAVDSNAHIADVYTLQELNAALENTAKTIINIKGNIAATAPVIVNRAVTINGGGYTLSFTGLESIATTVDDGLIIQAPATVNNLIVDAGLTAPEIWAGTYAIHVYKTTATLNNITATKGNGGILVNGSDVTLTGAIDVTGNGFGGIESSQGEGTEVPALTVGGTLVNSTEAIGLPTIWEDGVRNTITATGDELVLIGINGQQQYYLVPANAIPVVLSGLDSSYTATVEQESSASITATLKTGVRSVENARLVIEVSKTGIADEDFTFTSIEGGTASGTAVENAGWLNATVEESTDKLTFYWGPENGTTFNTTVTTTANFIFMKAGVYEINMKLVQVGL